ncbi:SGNH/GDSL hydrolase family protein [Pedosphaera parvula]|uniref:SGNH hydrolase-type esterase domain-containing protein n=1 Tax=Pedosphaera parvula (strain Ellin514) TaxID=320771 RepID=B9XR46_PEDPL|nr:SGNH/GDSL hydrolase family protein [Pedosphaera parvula]EEF57659.1 hypothetical protein Cflav_PD0694 [Pedosphaera parvula Ellin514]
MKGSCLWNQIVALVAATFIGCAGWAPAAAPGRLSSEKPKAKSPWERIVLVGASATAGFTGYEPFGGSNTVRHSLSRYVDAALIAPHEPVTNLATAMFFFQPETIGRTQIENALKANPTLVIGADFLFWYCYGRNCTDEERLQRFEKGLKLLEGVKCPLVLGDIPDASGAANEMLTKDQMPSAKVLATANKRLKEWAGKRPRVVIVSLSAFMRTATANEALRIRGFRLEKGKTRMLLQYDKLHPSPPGAAVLAVAILDAVQARQPTISINEIRWNPKEVFRLGFNPPQKVQTMPAAAGNAPPQAEKPGGS